jgi:hypothetical protein
MAYKLQLKRGASGSLPTGSAGEPLFTTDTNDLYIGTGAANQRFQKYIASGTSSQFLKGDGSLDSTTYTPTSRTLTINGTSYDLSANRTWSVGTITTAAATTGGQVSFFNGATVITSVSGLYFDGVDKLSVGNSSPAYNLDVTGTFRSTGNLTAASIIKSGGTSSQYLMADGSTSTLTNPVTGTGTTNYLPKWTSGSAIGNSAIVDNTLNVTISKSDAVNDIGLQIQQTANFTASYLYLAANNDGGAAYNHIRSVTNGGTTHWQIGGGGTASTMVLLTGGSERARITSSGNLLVNSTTDNGNRLQVTGNASFTGTITANDALTISKAKAGAGVESNDLITLRYTGTGAIGDSANIRWRSTDGSYTIASINGISGADNVAYGTLAFSTRRITTDSLVEAMRIDNRGNLGLGVQPSAWNVGYKAVQIANSALWAATNDLHLTLNTLWDGAYKYIDSGYATRYNQYLGQHLFYTAPSGTAGNAITFTQAMTLTANGRLLLGTTTEGTDLLDVNGTGRFSSSVSATSGVFSSVVNVNGASSVEAFNVNGNIMLSGTGNRYIRLQSATNYFYNLQSVNDDFQILEAGTTPRLTIKYPNGNVLIGTTTDSGEKLQVSGSVKATSATFANGVSNTQLTVNGIGAIKSGINFANSGTTYGQIYFDNNAPYDMSVLQQYTTGSLIFGTNNTERMRIKANGSVRYIPMATPASAEAGDVYYDSSTNKLRCYNGTSWNDLF